MHPPDPRDPNSAASAEWPGETWISQRSNENPTLPRMAPIPTHQDAAAPDPSAPASGAAVPPMPRYAPPPSDPAGSVPLQPLQPASPLQGYPVTGQPPRSRPAGPSAIDIAAVPSGAWLAFGGGLAMLIGSFLPWITVSVTGVNNHLASQSQSGWDLTAFGRVTALLGLLALVLFIVRLLNVQLPVRLPWSDRNIYMALGIEALLLGLLYLIDNINSAVNVRGLSVSPAFGLFLTLLGAIALTGGAYLLTRPTSARS